MVGERFAADVAVDRPDAEWVAVALDEIAFGVHLHPAALARHVLIKGTEIEQCFLRKGIALGLKRIILAESTEGGSAGKADKEGV
mgnify:CR=1 FL=1